ncbi:hypothetical protein SAMN02745121_03208 [Nannocystis exedens]|uniref:Uncharacterized protein n=1 Tax=Nannocystis exedens TaxID=54 RepID=A0A1I1Y6U1_9BACT|nr:dispase autolysis-inducing protein [Nannocystis exedens]PCC71856.1 dispase autolysis-inducing protein [Nannocystis exedens]SFE15301.1 hypothetical protein SAMN02745121_03208 [Nannocystis exedens]
MTYLPTTSTSLTLLLLTGPACLLGACVDDLPVGQTGTETDTVDTTTLTTTQASETAADPTTDPSTTESSTTDAPTSSTVTSVEPTTATTSVEPTTATTAVETTTDDTSTTAETTTTTSDSETSTTDSTTGPGEGWQPPNCASVTGTGAVTFSFDQGATLAPMDQQIQPVTYTFGLVALGKPGAMLAGSGQQILASSDAGCSWHSIGAAGNPNAPAVRLHAAGETRAYAYGDNNEAIVRVDDEVITKLSSPAGQDGIVGLGVDPNDPDHVRIGDTAGRVWDSVDAGLSWVQVGIPAFAGSLAYRAAFDPQDIDHVLFGALAQGVLVSHDAGEGWQSATGLSPGDANGFNLVVSPVDGEIVWVEGLDLEDPNDQTQRHVYRSEDGGLTFTPVVEANEAKLYNGNHLFPHPTDPDVLYFVFGSNYQGYGTDLYRYDYASDSITLTHNMWHDTVITFLPSDPSVIYLGLSIEPGGG